MLRFNGFAMIHKALRAMLYDTAQKMQQANFADPEGTLPAFAAAERIVELFDDHADHEDNHILSGITDVNPGLAQQFEAEHVTDRQLAQSIKEGIDAYKNAGTPMDRIVAGNKVFYAFNEFIAFNLKHMVKEETVLNETLWGKYTDAEIAGLNQKIAASVAPDKAIDNLKWMMKSCNDVEIGMFVKNVVSGAPEHLVNMVMSTAQAELSAERWEMLKASLSVQAIA